MKYTLMHKNIPVVDMQIDEATGTISKIEAVHDIRHLPLGIKIQNTSIDRKALNDWWTGRCIPASRDGIREALERLEIHNTARLLTKCCGLSLSDHYWVCPKDSGLRWEAVNFFTNDFSKDIGEILFGFEPNDPKQINFMSPDNTSDGWLRKKWIIADGKRYLMKGGSGVFQQEPFNEVIASAVMRRLNIPHVPYTLTFDSDKPYSLCENFVTPDTELVPAWRVHGHYKKDNRDSNIKHLLRGCETLGIPGIREALDKMLVLDYIIANEDRHYNNFGFIRNAETLEWLGAAPIFDSGTSLWYNTRRVGSPVECKPFRSSHIEQIKLAEDLSWFDSGTLVGLLDEIMEILSKSEEADDKRRTAIASAVMERCGHIKDKILS
ncbi:MAG: excisionase [Defluviitaleaceae bacterium]|nr:excisionase [Defluviitaleaceae bacterium]